MARGSDGLTPRGAFIEFLPFERLIAGPLTHLIYWCGLGLIVMLGFATVGGAVGVAIRGGAVEGALLTLPVLVGGVLLCAVLSLLWRGACEFYLAVLNISQDLTAMRAAMEREEAEHQRAAAAAQPRPMTQTMAPPPRPVASGDY
ncbi:hypothetical protein BH09PSE2_BH09PSE2_13450 [soil metagenome]